jgi:hypothetical protein
VGQEGSLCEMIRTLIVTMNRSLWITKKIFHFFVAKNPKHIDNIQKTVCRGSDLWLFYNMWKYYVNEVMDYAF